MYPKVFLSIDNCFASKRWTTPRDWMTIVEECGLRCIEGSADTECDMLYSAPSYLANWLDNVKSECKSRDMKVVSVYTGHGTYSTLGLTHTDFECRNRMLEKWLFPHIDNASALEAVAGFYCHAFDDTVLQDPAKYDRYLNILLDQMKSIARYCKKKKVLPSLEQMYSPQQFPWRIADAEWLIREVSKDNTPFYITIDTGHQCGQKNFYKPTREQILEAIYSGSDIYVGAKQCYDILSAARNGKVSPVEAADRIEEISVDYPFLYAQPVDSDTYSWIRRLGCYSPIIHLQQTDNYTSSHKDFSIHNNSQGIITGEKVLHALYDSYRAPRDFSMPPPVDSIYLTLELFYSNTEKRENIIKSLKVSVDYWRQYIPEDGLPLDVLISRLRG